MGMDTVLKVTLLNGLVGLCLGFLQPALDPTSAKYASVKYPTKMGLAQSIPLTGLQLAVAFSQNIMAKVVGASQGGLGNAWCCLGLCCFVFVAALLAAHRLVEKRTESISEDASRKEVPLD